MAASMPSHYNQLLVPDRRLAVIGLEKYDCTRIADANGRPP